MKKFCFLIFMMILFAGFTACNNQVPVDNPDNPDNPDTPGTNPGTTTEGFDVFNAAFNQKGNIFVYRFESSMSYVAYGSGTKTSHSAGCTIMQVTEVSGNTATVKQVRNFDFNNPGYQTFKRGSKGELFMGSEQVTMTQSPIFWGLNFGMSEDHELKEYYSDGEYKNVYYTKSNSYYTPKAMIDITEIWNKYGMYYSSMSEMTNEPSNYNNSYTQVSAKTATEQYEKPGIQNIPAAKLIAIDGSLQSSGDAEITIKFTQSGTKDNTWGYCLGIFMNGDDGQPYCKPLYEFDDIDQYFSNYIQDCYNPDGYGTHYFTFRLSPEGVNLGNDWGSMSFGIFALGYNYLSEASEMATMNFSDPASMPARIEKCKVLTPAKKVDGSKRYKLVNK